MAYMLLCMLSEYSGSRLEQAVVGHIIDTKPAGIRHALHPMPSSTHSTPLTNPRHHFMILRVRRFLIQHLKRLPIQLGKLALEPNPMHPRNIIPVIVLQKQRQIVRIPKLRPLDLQLLDVIGL